MTIRLQFDRIGPGVEIGPHRHGVETIMFLAGGELVFEHGEDLERRTVVKAGDVLYEAPSEYHLVRNEANVDALALLAAAEPDPRRPGTMFRRWEAEDEPVRRGADARVMTAPGIRGECWSSRAISGRRPSRSARSRSNPGRVDTWHRHAGAEHAIVVFEGRGVITVGEATETLEPLKGIRVEAGLAHRVENTGRTSLRYYVCAVPGLDPTSDREPAEAPRRRLDA